MEKRTPNDLGSAVPKLVLTLEEYRRTPDGRVRPAAEFLQHFFPHDARSSTDRLFKYLPNDVRGPVLTGWGLRGAKSAVRDTDEKVQSVVHDALLAGDIDHDAFERAVVPEILVRWIPLADWWSFWRAGKLSKLALHKAFDTAYELGLFDAKWFFDTIETPNGKLRGTDVVSDGLTKQELTEWIRKVHASGDGSPRGLLAAIGWDRVVGKTPNDVLIKVVDALAAKIGLVAAAAATTTAAGNKGESAAPPDDDETIDDRPSTRITPVPPASPAAESTGASLAPGYASAPRPPAPSQPTMQMQAPARTSASPPAEEKVESLFSDSVMPPADEAVAIDVDEDDGPGETPTNRPPSSEPAPMPVKGRLSTPPQPPPAMARRR